MQQLLQHLGDGRTLLVTAPAPGPRPGALLIRTSRSLVSAGTERMLVDFGRAGLIGKARRQPEKVRAVLAKMRSEGLIATWRAVRAKLEQPIPLGYCHVGTVIDAGEAPGFSPGDRVVSNGPHAEVVSVAQDLCARIPDGVEDEAAAFVPLAAIAWEGINLLKVVPGDRIVVIGLGLIGQIAVRILRLLGCEVLGFDPYAERRALAERHGAVMTGRGVDADTAALAWTGGHGVAGVLITASASTDVIVNQAARSCRRRGRVVLVGVVGLRLNRADFYRNEVSFQVSCSYGVRSVGVEGSARDNFEQVLSWMAEQKLEVGDLVTNRIAFDDAHTAYAALVDSQALGIMLVYNALPGDTPREAGILSRTFELAPQPARGPRVAVVGAGNFALRTLLPALVRQRPAPAIAAVVSHQGAAAVFAAHACRAATASTDLARVLCDDALCAVFLTTRHDAHARQAIACLQQGKHVWVEKPLALRSAEVEQVAHAARESGRVLMVGFNRRFSPLTVALRRALDRRSAPVQIKAVINAGRLPFDHWTLDPKNGGGRIVGEGCHWIDLMRHLAGAPIIAITCVRRDTDGQDGGCFELGFANGSSGMLDYRTDLPPHMPKELIEITGSGFEARIQNWAKLSSRGLDDARVDSGWFRGLQKGHPQALAAFLDSCTSGVAPIPIEEVVEVSLWAINAQALSAGQAVPATFKP
jgi:predicted dehydrogenase/D-arabinose 1-dehydrogenase-like Zn-dependent alcohol dehydrogenase